MLLWNTHKYSTSAAVCGYFLITSLETEVLWVEFSNLQDIFIITKCCLVFWPYCEKQDGSHGHFFTFSKEFCWPSIAKGIIGRDLKFAGYVHHYKILTGNISGLILKNKMAATGISFSVMKHCAEIFPLPPLELKVLYAEFLICRICSSLQKLAGDYFWPDFEKLDGSHGHFFDGNEDSQI